MDAASRSIKPQGSHRSRICCIARVPIGQLPKLLEESEIIASLLPLQGNLNLLLVLTSNTSFGGPCTYLFPSPEIHVYCHLLLSSTLLYVASSRKHPSATCVVLLSRATTSIKQISRIKTSSLNRSLFSLIYRCTATLSMLAAKCLCVIMTNIRLLNAF
ncbi:Efflux pump rdc3 [Fusarium oxysporum f. sp. albedinis]|nr:Efflux pump rdc3 [Fusarium oxysporum f. sp. albedinis]